MHCFLFISGFFASTTIARALALPQYVNDQYSEFPLEVSFQNSGDTRNLPYPSFEVAMKGDNTGDRNEGGES